MGLVMPFWDWVDRQSSRHRNAPTPGEKTLVNAPSLAKANNSPITGRFNRATTDDIVAEGPGRTASLELPNHSTVSDSAASQNEKQQVKTRFAMQRPMGTMSAPSVGHTPSPGNPSALTDSDDCRKQFTVAFSGATEESRPTAIRISHACRESFISRYINHSIWLSSPIACVTISRVTICGCCAASSSHRARARRERAIQTSASSLPAFADTSEKIGVTFWQDATASFQLRVMALTNYCNPVVPATTFDRGDAATDRCPNGTRNALAEKPTAPIQLAPRKSRKDVELAKVPKIPGSDSRKRKGVLIGLDVVQNLSAHSDAAVKHCTKRRQSDCGAITTAGRKALRTSDRTSPLPKALLGDMSIIFCIWIFSSLPLQVLVALDSSFLYVPAFKKRKPGRLP
jgi:hypothetical protein